MKHTPGPWHIVGGGAPNSPDFVTVIKSGNGIATHIARMHDNWICEEHGGDAFSNARLIAAAPEMLEALTLLVQAIETDDEAMVLHRVLQAKEVLAKI